MKQRHLLLKDAKQEPLLFLYLAISNRSQAMPGWLSSSKPKVHKLPPNGQVSERVATGAGGKDSGPGRRVSLFPTMPAL